MIANPLLFPELSIKFDSPSTFLPLVAPWSGVDRVMTALVIPMAAEQGMPTLCHHPTSLALILLPLPPTFFF